MGPPNRWWERVRDDQDRALRAAGYLARAQALRAAGRPPRGIHARRKPGGWTTPARVGALAAAIAIVGALALGAVLRARVGRSIAFVSGTDGRPRRVGEWLAAPSDRPLVVTFSDGTHVALGAGARARVSEIDLHGARVVVERGDVEATVVHRDGSRWAFDVGPFEVNVVGTRFDVSWDPTDESFRLRLRDGRVVVSGACLVDPQTVSQGREFRVSCKAGHQEILTVSEDPNAEATPPPELALPVPTPDTAGQIPDAASGEGIERPSPSSAPGTRPASHPQAVAGDPMASVAWRDLIAGGRFADALALVEQHGFDNECRRATGEQLLELGDASRFAGNSSRAWQAYGAARQKLPPGGRVAYSMGLTAFHLDGDFALAAHWFEVYLSEQPGGELRREAAARVFEAWQRAGDHAKARAAAAEYLREYSNGAQAPRARTLLAP